ncbi:MAG TPA: alanyl-tRNA synthetase [Bacteroidia bacterium]|nr:alanyl-tRNA synthetase [Bacteroidia bacterium]HRH09621.1 alanyl-tRNA synthetase [Bacteroidia bacterium]HRH64322.1 alanyl-tRNA synthetase [Bacteroidia bacterium]
MTDKSPVKRASILAWLKRIGWVGFFFFLLKGLVWIALSYWIVK